MNKKIKRDLKFYKEKLDSTIANLSSTLSVIIILWIIFNNFYKVPPANFSSFESWLIIFGFFSIFYAFAVIINFITKLLVFGKTLK